MIRAFSFPASPERSRLRAWLEGTLAGLCELHLLRERQERRVRQALRIAAEPSAAKPGSCEAGGGGEPSPEEQLDALPELMWEMEQQLGLLRLYGNEKTCGEAVETDSWPSSGFYEGQQSAVASDSPASGFEDSSSSIPSASGSYSRISHLESRLGYSNERPKSRAEEAAASVDQSPSFGACSESSLGSAKGGVVRQSSLCKRPTELLSLQAERRHPPSMERGSSTPSPCGHEGGAAVTTTRVWSSWDAAAERTLAAKTVAEDFHPLPSSLRKPPKLQALAQGRSPSLDPYDTLYPSSPLLDREERSSRGSVQEPVSYESEEGGCLMVKAQYIPAQQPPWAQQAHRGGRRKPPPLTKGRSVELSPERVPLLVRERLRVVAPAKKCRFTEEGSDGAARKGGGRKSSPKSKKAARSQSENSLLNRSRLKYGTVDREESAQKPSRQRRLHRNTGSGYRKWSSTAELSQEELSPGSTVEPPRGQQGPGPAGYTYPGSDSEYSGEPARRAPVCRLEEGLVGGDSDSSLSDGDSPPPYSSGASSDTDESGGLVWPQQLSPQLVSASGPGKATSGQPKVFVKIKASHALKKKIMRFRSGSLKVMTTV
ncbi:dapper homolog 3 [Protobothrops mucrosquamatus]|uniref:dapper homolog 3 n=1 Tax=Protobothrops mucrosquamatus TaxID=103944 RepID=UPI0010FB43CB|nr:dapper homolog 3 [Protobothrops mucrosquamatus]